MAVTKSVPGPLTWLYIHGTSLLGWAILARAAFELWSGSYPISADLLVFMALCALTQLMPVPLFRNSAMSVNFVVAFASVIYLGPAAAVVANLGGGLMGGFRPHRKPLHKILWNIAQLAICTQAAGLVYTFAGGTLRPAAFDWALLPPAILGITTYFFINTFLIASVISLTTNSTFTTVWGMNYRWLAPNYVGMGLIGFGMGVAVSAVGLLGMSIFFIPLAMAWYSFKLYMAKTEEVRRRNEELRLTNAQLDVANARLNQRVTELAALNKIGLSLNGSLDLSNVLGEILDSALRLVPTAQAAAVALADPASGRLQVASSIGLPAEAAAALQAYNGAVVRTFEQNALTTIGDTIAAGEGSLADSGVRALVALPLRFGGAVGGVFVVTFAGVHDVGEDEQLLLSTLAEQAATAVHNARLYQEIEAGYLNTIQAMVTVVDARERYAQGHSERIRGYAVQTARDMGLDERQTATLELAAMFHDIGHIGVPEAVLNKPGQLNSDEWEMVRKHPLLGVSILKQVPRMEAVIPVILQHHERYDGLGYPVGLLGNDTHVLAQILAVADAYEAMTSARPHRPALTRQQALVEIQRGSGSQFAPQVVDAFVQATAQPIPDLGTTEAAFVRLFATQTRR
jgi:hypothetical protein